MNISARSLVITFSVAFFIVALFLGASPPTMQTVPDSYSRGRVLGVSEETANRSFDSLGYRLPENDYRPIVVPIKSESASLMALENCAGVSIDGKTGVALFTQEAEKIMPIASITKLMTAMVFLDTKPDWKAYYRLRAEDRIDGGRIYLLTGEEVTKRDLFYLSLVGSDNTAAQALVHSTGMTNEEFVKKMNEKAKKMELGKTSFIDPVGISVGNVSTAMEIARLGNVAFENKYIQEAALTKRYEFSTLGGRKSAVDSTDVLLEIFPENGIKIMGGKTGYTPEAGYCFVGKFVGKNGQTIVSAVLGGDSINSRFRETRHLTNWVYDNFVWQN